MTQSVSEKPVIDILLAIHNGEKYFPELFDSLLKQSYPFWRLLVRDDSSTDATSALLEALCQHYPDRVVIISDNLGKLGACQGFSRLLEQSTADYLMFCDHDDIWLPQKIELTLTEMLTLEKRHGKESPLLVHTDLRVVDERLQPIAASLWRSQQTDPFGGISLNRLLVQNCVTGCSVMVNRALAVLAKPIPQVAMMHDWWLALAASAFGRIGSIDEPTILYRQHGGNDTGARFFNLQDIVRSLSNLQRTEEILIRIRRQAAAFADCYQHRLHQSDREMVATFARLSDYGFWVKRYYMLKYRFFYTGLIRNIGRFVLG